MRKRVLLGLAVLCLAGLAVGTRFGDVVVYTADWWFAAAVALLFSVFCCWWLPDHLSVPLSLDWTTLGLTAVLIILICISPYRYGAQVEAAKLGGALLLAFMIANLIQERSDVQFCLNALLSLGVGLAAVSFAYYMAAMSPLFYFTPLWARNLQYDFAAGGALRGIWQYQNTFGAFLVLCLLVALGLATGDRRRDRRFLYDFCAGFLLMVLYLTTSRGAFLCAAIGFIVFLLLTPRGHRRALLLRTGCIVAVAAGITVFNRVTWATTQLNAGKTQAAENFVSGAGDSSLGTRLHLMFLSLRLFVRHPWAGTGLGTFPLQWTAAEWTHDVARRIDPHSFLFRSLAETGLLGTVPLFAWILRRLIQGLDRVRSSRGDSILAGLWAGTLAFLLHMCMDVDYVYAVAPAILFFCLALLASGRVRYDLLPPGERALLIRERRWACLCATGVALLLAMAPIDRGIASLSGLGLGSLDPAAKVQRLTMATIRDPRNDTYWEMLGNAATDDPETARTAYEQAIRLSPMDYRPRWSLGMLELSLKQQDAILRLQEAERLYPTLAGIKGWLALAYVYVDGDTVKAETAAAQALAIQKDDPYALVARGFCALARGATGQAQTLFTAVARQGFTNRFVYYGLSLCYRARGDTTREIAELQYSRRVNPILTEATARLNALTH